jgi:hypothetical protein
MKKIVLFTSASLLSIMVVAQCVHTLPSTVKPKLTNGSHLGTGDAIWICEGVTFDIIGESTTAYIEFDCDITITGDNQTNIFMKGPGDIIINGDNGVFELDSSVQYVDNGTGNTINICYQATQKQKFKYDNISGVTGCIDTSGSGTGINHEIKPVEISVYPNPAHDVLNVELKNFSGTSTYAMYSISGQIVLNGSLGTGLDQIDVSSLEKGLYFIEITNVSGKLSKRISVE